MAGMTSHLGRSHLDLRDHLFKDNYKCGPQSSKSESERSAGGDESKLVGSQPVVNE